MFLQYAEIGLLLHQLPRTSLSRQSYQILKAGAYSY